MQSTIAAKLKPSALEFFRKRGADKLSAKSKLATEEAPAPPAAAAESGRMPRNSTPRALLRRHPPRRRPPRARRRSPRLPGPARRGAARRPRSRRRHHGVDGRVDIRRRVCSLHP